MRRTFIYDDSVLEVFLKNSVTDAAQRAVENAIMRQEGATLAGTGGLRKIRCASQGRGKSGSVRVIFADYSVAGRVYVLSAFGKGDKENVSAVERNLLQQIKRRLDAAVERLVRRET